MTTGRINQVTTLLRSSPTLTSRFLRSASTDTVTNMVTNTRPSPRLFLWNTQRLWAVFLSIFWDKKSSHPHTCFHQASLDRQGHLYIHMHTHTQPVLAGIVSHHSRLRSCRVLAQIASAPTVKPSAHCARPNTRSHCPPNGRPAAQPVSTDSLWPNTSTARV